MGVPVMAQWLTNLTRNHGVEGSCPWPRSVGWGFGVAVSCGVGGDMARIWHCCGMGWQLQLRFSP